MSSNTLLLMDGTNLAYRAFFAIRELSTRAGRPTNAVYGFIRMVRQLEAAWRPTHWAVIFDGGTPPARLELLPTYKAQREEMPDALRGQFAPIEDYLRAARVPALRRPAEEADDLMASLAARASEAGARVLLATSDKDLFQLVTERVAIVPPTAAGATMGPEEVRARTGVPPDRIVDWLALVGDTVDNIPGVPGVGPKTAAKLLSAYGSIPELWAQLEQLPPGKLRQALTEHRTAVERNLALVRLRTDLVATLDWDALRRQPADAAALRRTYAELEFHGLARELDGADSGSAPGTEPSAAPASKPPPDSTQLELF